MLGLVFVKLCGLLIEIVRCAELKRLNTNNKAFSFANLSVDQNVHSTVTLEKPA